MRKASFAPKTAPKVAQTTAAIAENPTLRVQRDEDTATHQDNEQPAPMDAPAEQPTPADTPAPVDVLNPAEQPAPVAAPPVRPVLTLEDLVIRANQVKAVTERVTFYRGTAEKLNSFELARPGNTDSLTIRDGQGKDWMTTQSSTIAKVLEVLRVDLKAATVTAEAELRELLQPAA